MAEDKQLTVAELLARARKDNPDAGAPKRRRRRSLEDGGISVAELTGSFPAVTDAPPQAKHTAVSIDGDEKPSTPAKTPKPEAEPAEAATPETKKPEPKKPEDKAPAAKPAETKKPAEAKTPEPKTPAAKDPAATPAEAKKPAAKKPAEPKKPEPQKPGDKAPAIKPAETKKPEPTAPAAKAPATKPTETKKPAEAKKPEPKTPAVKAPAATPAGAKKPEPKAPVAKPAETKKPEAKKPEPKTPAPAKKIGEPKEPPAGPTKPAAAETDDAQTGVLKKVDAQEPTTPAETKRAAVEDTGVMSAVGDSAASGNVRLAERPRTDVAEETDEESGGSPVAVIGMAVVGIVLGAVVFFVFEMLWGALNPWLTGALALVVTVAMIFAVRALRTARDSMTMTLAGLVGLVTTFGPALIAL